jgi:MFS transporter, PAT family, beta-lactamase induction signal transducer AmpG
MSPNPRRPLAVYLERQNLIMLALGFSSGLPFMLVANTLGYWLRDEGTSLKAIGFIAWVGFAYTFKFLWAPLIDRTSVPLLARLGRRRSWMLMMQAVIAAGLAVMGTIGLSQGLVILGIAALVVAFASATQDVTVDAWRIETARNPEELGVMTSSYTFGYRAALLASEAIILLVATRLGWNTTYVLYGTLMVVGMTACLVAAEPRTQPRPPNALTVAGSLGGLVDSIINPFVVFFRTHGTNALLMLLAISLFQIPNFVMGPMTNPLYHDIGLTKDTVGAVRGTFGLVAVFAGVAAGGFLVLKLGRIGALMVGGSAQILGTMAYAILPYAHDPVTFAIIMAGDNFGIAMAGVTLVTYMSSLTTLGYTATQYALLSSVYTVFGKLLKGFSGTVVEGLAAHTGLMEAYALFFTGAGLIGIPAILLFLLLASRRHHPAT